MPKRGQVTIFIIIAIIMLFLTSGLLFVVKIATQERVQTEQKAMEEILSSAS